MSAKKVVVTGGIRCSICDSRFTPWIIRVRCSENSCRRTQTNQPPEPPDFRPVKVIAHCHGNWILKSPTVGEVEGAKNAL